MLHVNRPGPSASPDLSGDDAGEVLTALYDAHADELHRYLAARSSRAVADDLVADTFLYAWQGRHTYLPDQAPVRAWLYGIATNQLRRHFRSEARAARAMARVDGRASDADLFDATAVARVDASLRSRPLARALRDLSVEQRDVLLLVALADLTPAEVAAATGTNATTVRSRLHRARAALRTYLEETDD